MCEPVKPLLGAINERLSADEELSFIKLNGNSKVGPAPRRRCSCRRGTGCLLPPSEKGGFKTRVDDVARIVCQPLLQGAVQQAYGVYAGRAGQILLTTRGLHSSTSQLNLSRV